MILSIKQNLATMQMAVKASVKLEQLCPLEEFKLP